MSQSCRVLSLHKSNSHIYQLSMMNQRHRAEYSPSRPLPHDPSLNPHLDSLSTPDWLQPLNHSPRPCVALVVPSRRLFTNITFTHPWQELSQHLRKTLWLQCDSSFPESPGLQHPFGALTQLQIPPGHLHQCLCCSPNRTNQEMHQCTTCWSDLHQQSSKPIRIGTTAPQLTHHWDDCQTILAHLESRLLSSGMNIINPLSSYRVILSQPWHRHIYINSQPPHLMFLYHHLWCTLRARPQTISWQDHMPHHLWRISHHHLFQSVVTNAHLLRPHRLGHPEVSTPIHQCNPALRAHKPLPALQPVTHTLLGVHPTHTTLSSKLHLHPYKMTAIPRQRNLTSSWGRIQGNSDRLFPHALCTSTTSPSSSKTIINKSPMLPHSCRKLLYSGGSLT